jgi:5-methylcytosine-specific restriction protein A
VSLADLTSRAAVLAALAEFDRLGRGEFLRRHGFREAREYYLVVGGRLYDSKAIAGVAHGYQFPQVGPLTADEFSGGEATVQRTFQALGFEVRRNIAGQRNPPWERDELILALDLYLQYGLLDDGDPRVVDLSEVLNRLPLHPLRPDAIRFRNPNGVALKLANFAALDPAYPGVGMTRGGQGDRSAWEALAADPAKLARLSAAIREEASRQTAEPLPPAEGEEEASEGRLLIRRNAYRERSRVLANKKKAQVLSDTGRLSCEVCAFEFERSYGDWGAGFIECHHLQPLSSVDVSTTRISDLAVVCSNCHRVLHRGSIPPTLTQLRRLVESQDRVPSGSRDG